MEGAEYTLKIAGAGAEHILALLMAALKPRPKGQKQSGPKLRGRERLRTMLKSGAELKFFEIQVKDLKEFVAAAKKYGITYCVLKAKDNEGGMVEIMAKAEDASRVSRILEKLEARDLGGGNCEQTKSAKEVKAEQKITEKAAKQKQREGVSEARQQFNAQRDILREQYNHDIGKEPKPPRERRQPRTRVGQLLRELTTEIARHIPVVGALVRRREENAAPAEEATAPAAPEHEPPAQDVADSLLAQPPAKEGKAEPEAPAAVQPEQPAAHPTTRTERTTKEKAPSAPLLPTSSKGSATISDQSSSESVKAFLDAEIASRRAAQKPPAKSKQAKQQGKQPKQPTKKSKKKDKVK
ncbi:MAG: DUF3801 domain-containing protein [Firmicutes bacterium]|nr:DUF3801 domain-containing protein [Bacillota bacterium]